MFYSWKTNVSAQRLSQAQVPSKPGDVLYTLPNLVNHLKTMFSMRVEVCLFICKHTSKPWEAKWTAVRLSFRPGRRALTTTEPTASIFGIKRPWLKRLKTKQRGELRQVHLPQWHTLTRVPRRAEMLFFLSCFFPLYGVWGQRRHLLVKFSL